MHSGHEIWFTRDYGGKGKALSINKTQLGKFVYHLIKLNVHITSMNALNTRYENSYVQIAISLPKGKKEELEILTGVSLEQPTGFYV